MNKLAPVSTIMSTDLLTVNPKDTLDKVKLIFDTHNIHHLPVVRYKEIVGIISKTDLLYFLKGFNKDKKAEAKELMSHYVDEIMTTGLAKIASTDRIDVALKVFKENLFHAIPIVDNNELVGIVTTYDIISALESSKTVATVA